MTQKQYSRRRVEEIEELHTRSLEWGCVTNLIDKISSIEEAIDGHWDELCNMIADMISEKSMEQDPARIFFDIYQYCFRLYYRLRANPTKRTFNQISKTTISGEEVYRITNYDYKTFVWAREGGFGMTITNDCIDLLSGKLTDNQRRTLERRLK